MKSNVMEVVSQIPEYPKACSSYLLAARLGLLGKAQSPKARKRAIRRLEKILFRATFLEPRLTERKTRLQFTTKQRLRSMGIQDFEDPSVSYFSLLPKRERKEE